MYRIYMNKLSLIIHLYFILIMFGIPINYCLLRFNIYLVASDSILVFLPPDVFSHYRSGDHCEIFIQTLFVLRIKNTLSFSLDMKYNWSSVNLVKSEMLLKVLRVARLLHFIFQIET